MTGYRETYRYQKELFHRRLRGEGENTLLVTSHEPTITMGKTAEKKDLFASKEFLRERGVDYVEIERGGGITYHGPGQVILYPIFDLRDYGKDLREFVRRLGNVGLRTADHFGLEAEFRDSERIGLWIRGERKKLCSIGLRVKRWFTMHGIALNVSLDEEKASLIRPCGVEGASLVSVADFTPVQREEVKKVLLTEFDREFSGGGESE